MSRIAKIVVDIALDREFDYLVPSELQNGILLGSRVTVPFGKSKTTGYVIGFSDKSNISKLKEIIAPVSDKPLVDEKIMDLAKWMSVYYCASLEKSIRTVLPGVAALMPDSAKTIS